MRFVRISAISTVLLFATSLSASNPKMRRGPTAPKVFKDRTPIVKTRSSLSIDPERATQIQAALIKAGYMSGTPTGAWDSTTQAAMEKLQSDNGWQTKLIPDSRAIIKLGLGPNEAAAGNTILANGTEEPETPVSLPDAAPIAGANK